MRMRAFHQTQCDCGRRKDLKVVSQRGKGVTQRRKAWVRKSLWEEAKDSYPISIGMGVKGRYIA